MVLKRTLMEEINRSSSSSSSSTTNHNNDASSRASEADLVRSSRAMTSAPLTFNPLAKDGGKGAVGSAAAAKDDLTDWFDNVRLFGLFVCGGGLITWICWLFGRNKVAS